MADFTINTNNNINDFSVGINTAPALTPAPVQPAEVQQPKQPSIYGEVPQIPTMDAVEGIKFDFNEGIRILFPHNGKEYHVTFTDIDTGIILYSADTVPGAYVTSVKNSISVSGSSSTKRAVPNLFSLTTTIAAIKRS